MKSSTLFPRRTAARKIRATASRASPRSTSGWPLKASCSCRVRPNRYSPDDHVTIMALNFPNVSRSYDTTRHAVRFWGYDSAMETSFFVLADALRQMQPGIRPDEESLLQVFDSHR